MKKIQVDSSNIKAIGYNPDYKTLTVDFKSGSTYRYSKVPSTVYVALMTASSHGKYFNAKIKKGNYPYRKVSEMKVSDNLIPPAKG